MRASAILEFVLSMCCFAAGCVLASGVPAVLEAIDAVDEKEVAIVLGVVFFGGGVLIVGLGIVLVLGAQAMSARRRYGLALAGAIIALVLGLKSLVHLGVFGLGTLGAIAERKVEPAVMLVPCGSLVLVLAAVVVDLIAGIWGLVVLCNERVRESFR